MGGYDSGRVDLVVLKDITVFTGVIENLQILRKSHPMPGYRVRAQMSALNQNDFVQLQIIMRSFAYNIDFPGFYTAKQMAPVLGNKTVDLSIEWDAPTERLLKLTWTTLGHSSGMLYKWVSVIWAASRLKPPSPVKLVPKYHIFMRCFHCKSLEYCYSVDVFCHYFTTKT